MEKRDITSAVVRRLVASQFPQWAHLPVTAVPLDGWDNATFRLGDALSARLPSADAYVAQIDKEHAWLPVLAPQLPLEIPTPVARGRPGAGFTRPWSVYRWIDGEVASHDQHLTAPELAVDLARFLNALRAIDATDGPPAGAHCFFRGGPLSVLDAQARGSIRALVHEIDAPAATEVWDTALHSAWNQPPVWVHGDVAPSNLLVEDHRLRAVIDFGCSAVGDPACDVVMAWTNFSTAARDVFRHLLALDDATWARGRGWALWKALITLAHDRHGGVDASEAARRFGWRGSAGDVIDRVLVDHGRSR